MTDLHEFYPAYPRQFPLPMILDGATGTALMKAGMPAGTSPELWVDANPDALRTIQRAYAAAGSDALYAPTFGANSEVLRRGGFRGDAAALASRLASLTRGVADECSAEYGRRILVGGDIAPTGLFIEPFGEATFEQVAAVYADLASAIADQVDFFTIETMMNLHETLAALRGVRDVSDKPVIATVTVDSAGRTMSGDRVAEALLALAAAGASAVGCNCSGGPAELSSVLSGLLPLSLALGVPLIAKPNAGLPLTGDNGERFYPLGAEEFASFAGDFLKSGVLLLGGCCGTDDSHIAALSPAVAAADTAELTGLFNRTRRAGLPDTANMICTAKDTVTLTPALLKNATPLTADDELADALDCEDGDFALIRVGDDEQAENVLLSAPLSPLPVALCGDRDAAYTVIRRYPGRALYIGETI